MPDLSFLASFANHPITLAILTVGAMVGIFLWKVAPTLSSTDKTLKNLVDKVVASDEKQTTQIAEIKTNLRNNVLDVLRITVYNESIAIEDRLVSARRYFLLGGNGKVARYVKGLIGTYDAEWRTILAICTADERTKLEEILK
jgi:hypothetical protein